MVKISNVRLCSAVKFEIIFLLMNFCLLSAASADEIILVANPDIALNSLSRDEVKSIFLGEKTKWDDGSKAVFVLLMTEDHEKFLEEFLGTTPMQYRQYWKKMVFTGRSRSPKSFKDSQKMMDYIAETAGAVGYLPSGGFNDRVKKISIR